MSLNMKYLKSKSMIGVVALFIGLLFFASFNAGTIISVSQIYVDPQGREVAGEWTGSFWNLVVSVQANDAVAGVVLPENQEGEVTVDGVFAALKTGAKIEIKIDPQQAYLYRGLTEKTVKVAPGATGGGVTVDPLWTNYYDWSGGWQIYSPYLVTVYKDGVQVGQKTINTQGQDSVQTIETSEGSVRIEHLGMLQGAYLSPNFPSQIAILKGSPTMYNWAQIQSLIDSNTGATNQYDDYWYGITRNSAGQAINPTVTLGGILSTAYKPSQFGGWAGSDYSGVATPVKPVALASQKSQLPSDERGFHCMTEWLEQDKYISNLANSLFADFSSSEFVTVNGQVSGVKLYVPWGGYATPIVNIRVPTELADTWVERPQVADVVPTAVFASSGSKYVSLTGSAVLKVDLKQESSVLSATRVAVTCDNNKVGISPVEMPSVSIAPGATESVYFTISNLGVESQASNIPVTITCYEKYTGEPTGSDTVYVTLLPSLVQEDTDLTVYAFEKDTDNVIVGLEIEVSFGGQTLTAFTGSSGVASFDLQTSAGGGYAGPVTVTTVEDEDWRSTSKSFDVHYGSNEVTLEVESKEKTYPDDDWSWLMWFAIPLTAAVMATFVLLNNRRLKK